MDHDVTQRGEQELSGRIRAHRGLISCVALFSAFANLLLLTGPLFMLQVYDRVLGSQSVETLTALVGLVIFLFVVMGVLDLVRGRVMARIGARLEDDLGQRVFDAMTRKTALGLEDQTTRAGLTNLATFARQFAAPGYMARFDLPFTPIFLIGIAIFHPLLGLLAVLGGAALVALTAVNQIRTRALAYESLRQHAQVAKLSEHIRDESEMVRSLGMSDALRTRWGMAQRSSQIAGLHHADVAARYAVSVKTLRVLLQSLMLALGAWLVLRDAVSPGAMIASSILMGRALAPVEQIIGQWPQLQAAREARRALAHLLGSVGVEPPHTRLPRPQARLAVDGLAVGPPGGTKVTLRGVSLRAQSGEAIGIIGPSGAGKSSLAKALTGLWPLVQGEIRLDGAPISQYDPQALSAHIGYLPQQIRLFDGTIAENIARMALHPDSAQVVAAAEQAAAHEMILRLPDGYDTHVGTAHARLSGGELQRVGLARALFGDPVVLILDEPNANLDHCGTEALNNAVRRMKARGDIVLIMAHRPAAIQECDHLLVIDDGQMRAFGPKDEVLAKVVLNHAGLKEPAAGAA